MRDRSLMRRWASSDAVRTAGRRRRTVREPVPAAERLEDRALLSAVGWERGLGGTSARALVVDATGAAYAAGTLDSDGDGNREVLAKFDASGVREWGLRYTGQLAGAGAQVAADGTGALFVTGTFSGTFTLGGLTFVSANAADVFLAKVDAATGAVLDSWRFGGTGGDTANGIAARGGVVYLSGNYDASGYFGANRGGTDGYVLRLDTASGGVTTTTFGGNGADFVNGVAIDAAGDAYVTGRFFGAASFGGQSLVSAGGHDGFVAKVSSSGGVGWATRFGSSDVSGDNLDIGQRVVSSEVTGTLYLAGGFAGTADFGGSTLTSFGLIDAFVAELTTTGEFLWARQLGGAGRDAGWGVTVAPSGDLFVGGSFPIDADVDPDPAVQRIFTSAGGAYDAFLVRLTAAGEFRSAWQVSSPGDDYVWATAVGLDGDVYAVGQNGAGANVPTGGILPAAGAYLMRLDPDARTIRGVVYNDADGSGTRGAEAGVAGRTVFADADGDGVFDAGEASASTDAAGSYRLIVAGAGDYLVRQVSPAGWSATGPGAAGHIVTVAEGDPAGSFDFGSRTALAAKFLVVDDSSADLVSRYTSGGAGVYTTAVAAAPRDVASNAAGTRSWVLSVGGLVTVYNEAGAAIGSWQATGLSNPQGIATNGTDLWVVDAAARRVYRFAAGAARLSGSAAATSSFALNTKNTNPTGVTTDGVSLWVVDDGSSADKVYKYTASNGKLAGSWTINYGGGVTNAAPTGISVDFAANGSVTSTLWVLDNASDRAYRFDGATGLTSGTKTANGSLQLAAGNLQGLADPPTCAAASADTNSAKKGGPARSVPAFAIPQGPEDAVAPTPERDRRDDARGSSAPGLPAGTSEEPLAWVLGEVLDDLLAA